MFVEFFFHIISISFLVICLVRSECFAASLDVVLVGAGVAEVTDVEGF